MQFLPLFLVAMLAIVPGAAAQNEKKTDSAVVEIDKKTADSIKTYTVQQFVATAEGLAVVEGQIIRLKFGSRGSIYQSNGESRCEIRDVHVNNQHDRPYTYVIVPTEGLKWFSRVPADYYGKTLQTVFGRVVKKGTSRDLQLLGHDLQSDAKGAKIVWPK